MSGTVDVDPVSLEEHATAVRNFMSQIEGATTSSASDTLDLQAFGLACIEPAQLLQAWIVGAQSFIKQAVAAGNEISDAITQMAESYREQEAQATGSFEKLQLNLQGGS